MNCNSSSSTIKSILRQHGFIKNKQIAKTLQGQIWHSDDQIIKVASKTLHNKSIVMLNGKEIKASENIITEKEILEYLLSFDDCPPSIIKYKGFFESNDDYYLCMEHGGLSLFDFVLKGHKLIKRNRMDLSEWLNIIKCIFKQMIDAIEYMHNKQICHNDISLENTLIEDININIYANNKIKFTGGVKIRIIDFGLSQTFEPESSFESTKFCGKRAYESPEVYAHDAPFNAKKNDAWCAGVCLWMMLIGCSPWNKPDAKDQSFDLIINGYIKLVLVQWQKLHYLDTFSLDLISKILKYENERISLNDIKEHQWLKM